MKKVIIISVCLIILLGLYLNAVENQKGKNCVKASSECQGWFAQFGIQSRMIYGSRWDGNGTRICHCWLEVDTLFGVMEFESTRLRFEDVSRLYEIDWREE